MGKKDEKEMISDLFYKMDTEGVFNYFAYYRADYDALEKLGFDTEKIKEAVSCLNEVYTTLEGMC